MNNQYANVDSMITTFNTAVSETASDILGKHSQKKKPWVTAKILDLCDKRRELRKKRSEPEGSEKYKEVNNNIKRCMNKAKENWMEEQCSEIEGNLRKNSLLTYTLIAASFFHFSLFSTALWDLPNCDKAHWTPNFYSYRIAFLGKPRGILDQNKALLGKQE